MVLKRYKSTIIVIVIVIFGIFVYHGYNFYESRSFGDYIHSTLKNYTIDEDRTDKGPAVIVKNKIKAKSLLVCRSYLPFSQKLNESLVEIGLSENVIQKISKILGTELGIEGTQLYFIRGDQIITTVKFLDFHLKSDYMYSLINDYFEITLQKDPNLGIIISGISSE